MYREFTTEIVGYKIKRKSNVKKAQAILKAYLIAYKVWDKRRDMSVEGYSFALGSAFYDEMVRQDKLEEWYTPIYARISLSKSFMKELGFKTTKDDGTYGQAKDIRSNGMTTIAWNREGRNLTYFGDKLKPNIGIEVRKDAGTRVVFNGYIFNERELKDILERTW